MVATRDAASSRRLPASGTQDALVEQLPCAITIVRGSLTADGSYRVRSRDGLPAHSQPRERSRGVPALDAPVLRSEVQDQIEVGVPVHVLQGGVPCGRLTKKVLPERKGLPHDRSYQRHREGGPVAERGRPENAEVMRQPYQETTRQQREGNRPVANPRQGALSSSDAGEAPPAGSAPRAADARSQQSRFPAHGGPRP